MHYTVGTQEANMLIKDYVDLHYFKRSDFSRKQGIDRQRLNMWISRGYYIENLPEHGPTIMTPTGIRSAKVKNFRGFTK